ncbi:MAG: ABC transporter permease [Rhodoferax sp.]|nr:ABC transporter permease [Rhodoferax sp.]
MQLSQIFIGLIVGGVLLAVAWGLESKILRLVAVLVAAAFVISGLGISRNVGLVILVAIAIVWFSISLYFKHKPREIEFGKEFMQDLKTRVEVREALITKELTAIVPVPAAVPAISEIVDLIELTEEEKIANLEKDAALAERETKAFLKKRAAERKRQQAEAEDAAEALRRQRQLEKEKNPSSPPQKPMSPQEVQLEIDKLEANKNRDREARLAEGLKEDSLAIQTIEVAYEKKIKALSRMLEK